MSQTVLRLETTSVSFVNFCDNGVPESLRHLMVRCQRWARLRDSLLAPMIREGRELLLTRDSRVSARNITALLLGGAVSGARLNRWDCDAGVEIDDGESDDLSSVSTVSDGGSPSMPTQDTGCYLVAEFLRTVSGLRHTIRRDS